MIAAPSSHDNAPYSPAPVHPGAFFVLISCQPPNRSISLATTGLRRSRSVSPPPRKRVARIVEPTDAEHVIAVRIGDLGSGEDVEPLPLPRRFLFRRQRYRNHARQVGPCRTAG